MHHIPLPHASPCICDAVQAVLEWVGKLNQKEPLAGKLVHHVQQRVRQAPARSRDRHMSKVKHPNDPIMSIPLTEDPQAEAQCVASFM
jgi:hypothetical protein